LANSWSQQPEPGRTSPLPKTELNPLLNPVLEQNLGRWAQVYFTNPPDMRERAVMDLLRELERHEAPSEEPATSTLQAATPSPALSAPFPSPAKARDEIPCPACHRQNRTEQKFCGFCGSVLRAVDSIFLHQDVPRVETPSVLGLASLAPESEVEFLRQKSFAGSYDPDKGYGRWKYVAVALVLVLAGAAYLQWPFISRRAQSLLAARPAAVSPQPQPAAPPAETAQQAQPAEPLAQQPAPREIQPQAKKSVQTPIAQNIDNQKHRVAPSTDSRAGTVTLASDSQATRASAAGAQELQLAQRYLEGHGIPKDSSVAATWLWKAVAKQNARADLLLADLYMRGDGVSKSCDQARILLTAAARKDVPGASEKLRTIESGGCQ